MCKICILHGPEFINVLLFVLANRDYSGAILFLNACLLRPF